MIIVSLAQAYNMFIALDSAKMQRHLLDMDSAAEILAALREKGVKQAEIARVLNIAQPNAATLYTPAKNGKLRKLAYDEGLALIKAFDLDVEATAATTPSAEALEPILDALLPLAPSGRMTGQSLRALAEALSYGLASLGIQNASVASSDVRAAAARAAVFRFREIGSA